MEAHQKVDHDLMLEIAAQIPLPVDGSLFLSVPDDVLKLIGYHVSPDSSTPMPSFQPTWVNHITQDDTQALKPLVNFRSTCRRVRSVVPLMGRWRRLQNMSELQSEAWFTPDDIMASTTRLAAYLDDSHKTYNSDGVVNTVSQLLRVLQRTPHLRELAIVRRVHEGKHHIALPKQSLLSLRLPKDLSLPFLKHISCRIECDRCASGLEPFFATLTANKETLKLYLPDTRGLAPLDDCFRFTYSRFGTPMLSLKTLYLRIGANVDLGSLLDTMATGCPNIRELHVSVYALDKLKILRLIDVEMIEPGVDVCTWWCLMGGAGKGMPDLPEKIGLLRNLQVLDLGLRVKVVHQSTTDQSHIATAPLTTSQLDQLESRQEEWYMRKMMNRLDLPLAQVAAARRLVQACPSLRQGWWWDLKGPDEGNVYERRGWTASIGNDGEPCIKLNDGALWLRSEFVNVYR